MSGHKTAQKAIEILIAKDIGFIALKPNQKRNLAVAFAKKDMIVYGKAFDVIKISKSFDLNDLAEVEANLDHILVYEVKSTNKNIKPGFEKYFFALTGAEVLVAQSLKKRFKFIFVNTVNGAHIEMYLNDIFARAKGIYPTCSIQF